MWPFGNVVDDVLFWCAVIAAFFICRKLWPYIKVILGVAFLGLILGSIFVQRNSNNTLPHIPPVGDAVNKAREELKRSRAWEFVEPVVSILGAYAPVGIPGVETWEPVSPPPVQPASLEHDSVPSESTWSLWELAGRVGAQ